MIHLSPNGAFMKRWSDSAVLAFSLWLCAFSAIAASDIVLIDMSDPAYTVYAGLPAENAENVRAKIANQPAKLVTFKELADDRGALIGAQIKIDDYPNSRAVDGIVELVKKYPGTPFGITWNGGIAFTRNDYTFAKRQYAAYNKNPEEYRQAQKPDSATDPVYPPNHLGPLLGW